MNIIFNSNLSDVIATKTNSLLYKFKEDMLYFKNLTSGTEDKSSVLIVGYNTFISLNGDILTKNNRKLWVLSKDHNIEVSNNVKLFKSYDDIINNYTLDRLKYNFWVIGGKQIYELFENITETIYHCHVQDNSDYIQPICYKPSNYFELVEQTDCNNILDQKTDKYYNVIYKKYVNKFKITDYKKSDDGSSNEFQYLNLLYKTLISNKRMTRNGNTYSYFGDQIRFNLQNGFPLLTTKKMFFKGIIHELLFFMKGHTNSKELEANGVNIWKGNTSRKFLDSNGFNNYEEGEMGPMYGYQWRHFNASPDIDQLKNVLNELENNITSRRLLMTTFNPLQVDQGVLYPCHSLIIQFYVVDQDDNRMVSLHMYQRSGDVFLGVPFNIASTSLLLMIICDYLSNKTGINYKANDVIISFGDVHLYEQHYVQSLEQLRRKPLEFCKLKIKNKHNDINDYQYDDFELENYKSYPVIKADMVP